jgi:hypothetical protein
VENLPLIETLASLFPDEWLAFIVPPDEDGEYLPSHGKLVAHSPNPDEINDAVLTVLWNQCVYVFFNGDYEAMEASYFSQRTYEVPSIIHPEATVSAFQQISLNW